MLLVYCVYIYIIKYICIYIYIYIHNVNVNLYIKADQFNESIYVHFSE